MDNSRLLGRAKQAIGGEFCQIYTRPNTVAKKCLARLNSGMKILNFVVGILSVPILFGCSSTSYMKTVDKVEMNRFMGDWYVIAGRFTWFERGAHNGVETYTWNEEEQKIIVDFRYRKDSYGGEKKHISQKAWIYKS